MDVEKLSVDGFNLNVSDAKARDMISDKYDPDNGTYVVGDTCINDDVLYICNTDIDTPEDFDSSKWDADTIGHYCTELKSNLTYKTDHVTGQTEFIVPSTATEVIVVCYVDLSTACGVFHLPNPRSLPVDLMPVTGYNISANTAGGYILISVNHTTGGIKLLNFIMAGQEKRGSATSYFYYR